jgi:hypothetical protein
MLKAGVNLETQSFRFLPFFDYRVRFSSGGSGGGFLSCFETMLYNLTRVFLWWLSPCVAYLAAVAAAELL